MNLEGTIHEVEELNIISSEATASSSLNTFCFNSTNSGTFSYKGVSRYIEIALKSHKSDDF